MILRSDINPLNGSSTKVINCAPNGYLNACVHSNVNSLVQASSSCHSSHPCEFSHIDSILEVMSKSYGDVGEHLSTHKCLPPGTMDDIPRTTEAVKVVSSVQSGHFAPVVSDIVGHAFCCCVECCPISFGTRDHNDMSYVADSQRTLCEDDLLVTVGAGPTTPSRSTSVNMSDGSDDSQHSLINTSLMSLSLCDSSDDTQHTGPSFRRSNSMSPSLHSSDETFNYQQPLHMSTPWVTRSHCKHVDSVASMLSFNDSGIGDSPLCSASCPSIEFKHDRDTSSGGTKFLDCINEVTSKDELHSNIGDCFYDVYPCTMQSMLLSPLCSRHDCGSLVSTCDTCNHRHQYRDCAVYSCSPTQSSILSLADHSYGSLLRSPENDDEAYCSASSLGILTPKSNVDNICKVTENESLCCTSEFNWHAGFIGNLNLDTCSKMIIRRTDEVTDTASETENVTWNQFLPPIPNRLIGRKVGVEMVDIVGELHCLRLPAPGVLVWLGPCLSTEDYVRMSAVCRLWRSICLNDKSAAERLHILRLRKSAVDDSDKENIGTVKFKKCDSVVEDFHLTCAKECLGDIQQVVVSSSMNSVQPFTSLFEKTRLDVRWEEELRRCPRCLAVAKSVPGYERGVCQDDCCKHVFCLKCLGEFHDMKPCQQQLHSSQQSACTRKSKKNLRRL